MPAATAARSPMVALQQSIGNRAVGLLVQAKLKVGRPGDRSEREADRVADEVMRAPGPKASENATIVPVASNAATSRRGRMGLMQRQRVGEQSAGQVGIAPASVDRVLASAGRPLDPTLQQEMEQRFGHAFSRVRVHSGASAEQSAWEVKAHACTVGHDIVFGAGRFAPGTQQGRRLIAHELAHVVQQSESEGAPFDQSGEERGLSR